MRRTRRVPRPAGVTAPEHEAELARRLYTDYHAPLLALARRHTGGDRQWAEDVVQETFIRAWRSGPPARSGRSLMPWLSTVARRIVIDDHRKRSVRPQEVGDESRLEAEAEPDGSERLVRSILVRDALQVLSEPHREALAATYFADRSVTEAAQHLGVPVGTVKSRVYYAMRTLRLHLEENGVTSA